MLDKFFTALFGVHFGFSPPRVAKLANNTVVTDAYRVSKKEQIDPGFSWASINADGAGKHIQGI